MDKHTRGIAARGRLRALGLGLALPMTVASTHAADSIVTTYAGGGATVGGDNVPATSVSLQPRDLAWANGSLYIVEGALGDGRVARVDGSGTIHTIAVSSQMNNGTPISVAVARSGNVYISTTTRIWKVTPGGTPVHYAGNAVQGASFVDGARALETSAYGHLAVDAAENLYVRHPDQIIVRISPDGYAHRFAGTGVYSSFGDGGPALQAGMQPDRMAIDGRGVLFFVDYNGTVRRITPDGIIDRVTGSTFTDDPMARDLDFVLPNDVGVDNRGNALVANLDRLRLITPRGVVKTYAQVKPGMPQGFSGDGGSAMLAQYDDIRSPVVDAYGNTYVIDYNNKRVRKITPTTQPAIPESAEAFGPPAGYGWESAPFYGSAIGDINGDGMGDVVVVVGGTGDSSPPTMMVYLRRRDGSFDDPLPYILPSWLSWFPIAGVVTADMNEDGKQDVVVSTLTGVLIYPGNASGLGTGVPIAAPAGQERAVQIATTDLDRDGNVDIVARTMWTTIPDGPGAMTVFYGNGAGGVSRTRVFFADEGNKVDFRIADVNRDGWPDIVKLYSDGTSTSVEINYNNQVGGFLEPRRVPAANDPDYVAAGDFDGDGRVDIAAVHERGAMALLHRDANGTYTYEAGSGDFAGNFTMVLAADFNNDGYDDLLALNEAAGFRYWEQARGALTRGVNYPGQGTMLYAYGMALGDLDGDGCKDLLMTGQGEFPWTVRRGTGCVRALQGRQPYFGFRGNDSPRPPSTTAFTGGAAPVTPATTHPAPNAVWQAVRNVMAGAWRSFVRDVSFARDRIARWFRNV